MDKLLKSPWFVKVISFLLAIMLYTIVGMGGSNNATGIFPMDKADSQQYTENVKIEAIYDDDKYILTGLPEEIPVQFEGTKTALNRFKLQRTPTITVDLTGYKEGDYNLRLELSEIPDDVTATISDRNVKVTLHKKVTKSFPVQVELLNIDKLPDGYIAEPAEFDVKEVSITGTKEEVDTISYVKGFVDVDGAKNDLVRDVELKAYNEKMGEIQLPLTPGTIEVKVPISNPKKEVPITIKEEGKLPDQLVLASIKPDVKMVSVLGPEAVLEDLNEIRIPVDLSTITEDKTIKVKLAVPDGAFSIDPLEVTLTIDVEEKENVETITFKDFPISITGLSDSLNATFITPKNGVVDLTVKGLKEDIEQLDQSDITAMVNMKDLTEGKHRVKIIVNGPDKYFFQQSITEALLDIENQTT